MIVYRPNHTAISVRNLDTSLRFYEALGFREVNRNDFDGSTIVHLRSGDYILEMIWYPKNQSELPLSPGFANDLDVIGVKHIALSVEDADAALADLRERGMVDDSIEVGGFPDGRARWIFFPDPDGVWIEVLEDHRFETYRDPWPRPVRAVVFGATGFAGSRIVSELRNRGHHVIEVSRSGGKGILTGDARDRDFVATIAADADLIVLALRADGKELVQAFDAVAAAAPATRIGIVGGSGSLRTVSGELLLNTDAFPEAAKPSATAQTILLEHVQGTEESIDWFYLSPSARFGSAAATETFGRYRLGADDLLVDETVGSQISGEDYAVAFVDEVERPWHRRKRFTASGAPRVGA